MRYEFEVGDYVKLIANKTRSSKPIGYIGKVLRTKMFLGFGVCCELDSDEISWSQFSDLTLATKAEYEAYHKPKSIAKFKVGDKVKLIANTISSCNPIGYIDFIREVRESDMGIWQYRIGSGIGNWSLESDLELYTESKFKVGDKVRILTDNLDRSFFQRARYYLAEAMRRGGSVFIVDKVTNNGRPEWNDQFIKLKGYRYVHPVDCFELAKEDEWATIVVKDKELCGYKVEQSASSSFIKIGCKAISRGEVQGFLNVCEKFSITRVYSEYVKGQSIGLDAIKEALK